MGLSKRIKVGTKAHGSKKIRVTLPTTLQELSKRGYGGKIIRVPSDVLLDAHRAFTIRLQDHLRDDAHKTSTEELTARAAAYSMDSANALTILDYNVLNEKGFDVDACNVLMEASDNVVVINMPTDSDDTETETEEDTDDDAEAAA